jgi:guanylate kinase
MNGKLFLIVGPSGSGKGTVIESLKKRHPDYVFPVSCTTRMPRPGEVDGDVYSYVSKDDFVKWIREGRFLEWAEVHQNHYYGMLKKPVFDALNAGKVVVREIDIQGYTSVAKIVPADNLVGIFILVKDLDELKRRILSRGKLPDEEVERRLESARREIAQSHLCRYQIESVHGQIERMVHDTEAIFEKELRSRD